MPTLEERITALEAKTKKAKTQSESFMLRITEQLNELEKRVAALEKSPPKKKRRELLINLGLLTQGNKPESREAFEARVRRAIKEVLET
jgi:hypothetical protein